MAVIEFRLDLVAGVARAPGMLFGGVLGQRIAALDHKILDDPVERGAVVKSLVGQRLEILDSFRGDICPQFNDHFAHVGFDDGNFVRAHIFLSILFDHLMESAGTILMLVISTRLSGRSGGWVGVVAIFSSTSSPLINLPKAVY